MRFTYLSVSCGAVLTACASSFAQTYSIDWSSIDCGGATAGAAGPYSLGSSIGQPISGQASAGSYQVGSGFWGGSGAPPCYPNCDHSTATPVLTANDFQCFLNTYAAGSSAANCDGSTSVPLLTANDFQCFLNKYAAGCT